MKKHNLSSQDVRAKILQLRDSLVLNLEFLQQCIDRDYEFLQEYFKRFGDLNYRPILSQNKIDGSQTYGERTEVMLEPMAGKYRATIKSLLDSIRLIEAEILPEDNPEGSSASSNADEQDLTKRRTSLREQFTVDAGKQGKALEPQDDSDEDADEPAPEENAVQTLPVQKAAPKPWRDTTPKAQTKVIPKQKVVEREPEDQPKEEPKAEAPQVPKQVGLSPLMRAKLAGSTSKLSELQKKYRKDEDDGDE